VALTLNERFPVAHPVPVVWERLADIHFVAACFPGAALQGEREDGSYEGTITMQLGPTKVSFAGSVVIDHDDPTRTATLRAKGADTKRTRASADATVRVEPYGDGQAQLHVEAEVDVVGPLAQFARAGGMELTRTLLRDFAAAVDGALPPDPSTAAVAGAGAGAAGGPTGSGPAATPAAAPAPASAATPISVVRILRRSFANAVRRWFGRRWFGRRNSGGRA